MISILILTLNEEANIPDCLESVKWSDDIVVLDSFSTDRTVEIAKKAGARVIQRKFDNEKNQRMFSLREIPFKYKWVYNPDADEITPDELYNEMLSVTSDPNRTEVAYRIRFKTMFMEKWIRHSSLYPTWVIRLFRPEKISFDREINLRYITDGDEGYLKHHFHHYSFNKGLNAWFDKHNKYSWQEAKESLKSLTEQHINWSDIFSFGNPAVCRKALKELSFRLPFRPALRFVYMYFLQLGFLDGWAGFHYCCLLSIYEYMIVLKMEEIRRKKGIIGR
jgi:glycosyltransferase involved in cell wall biosynthesis